MGRYAIEFDTDTNGAGYLRLNRPDVHNAFDDGMIQSLSEVLAEIEADQSVRALVVSGNGKSFSAGADLNWMKRMAGYDRAQNFADARALAGMLKQLNDLSVTTVASVQGAAMGGGVGLASCCDIVLAADTARFALSEVRLGLIPATISPYVIAAIGARQARRYMQTGERFSATEAYRIGLAHQICPQDELQSSTQTLVASLLDCGPNARAITKKLISEVQLREIDDDLLDLTAKRIADVRASDEGREGVAAFLERRKPDWN